MKAGDEKEAIVKAGDMVEHTVTGAYGIVKQVGSRSSKVLFYCTSPDSLAMGAFGKKVTRQVNNGQLKVR